LRQSRKHRRNTGRVDHDKKSDKGGEEKLKHGVALACFCRLCYSWHWCAGFGAAMPVAYDLHRTKAFMFLKAYRFNANLDLDFWTAQGGAN
ncbi:MAG: hypothetical protein RLZZ157_1621, partial [Pseudomonadota bacterium]